MPYPIESVDYLHKYSSFSTFSVRKRKSPAFRYYLLNSPVSGLLSTANNMSANQFKIQIISAISFSWFADFGKSFTFIQRTSQLVPPNKWQASQEYYFELIYWAAFRAGSFSLRLLTGTSGQLHCQNKRKGNMSNEDTMFFCKLSV